MHGIGWLLFSFRGEIRRSEFIIGIFFQWVLIFILSWLINFILFNFFVDQTDLIQQFQEGIKAGKQPTGYRIESYVDLGYNEHKTRLSMNMNYLGLIPMALGAWITASLYVKRYRDIGINWYLTVPAFIAVLIFGGFIPPTTILSLFKSVVMLLVDFEFSSAFLSFLGIGKIIFTTAISGIFPFIGTFLCLIIPIFIKEIPILKYR